MSEELSNALKGRLLSDLLMPLQGEAYQLSLLKEANEASAEDLVPGQNYTYGSRLADLEAAQRRLIEAAEPEVVNEARRVTNG